MSEPAQNPRQIFAKALEYLSPIERAEYLAQACGDNAELRSEIESLLRAHAGAGDFLEGPVFSTTSVNGARIAEGPSSVIGRYKLLEKIGEGGMGVVYMAEQTEALRRRVALKIIKPGMDSKQVVGRFEAERQTLALMDHPNIARVFDAGTTDSGRPYFVMELVRGVPITEYCDNARLSPNQRLELFLPVCRAIQHAHQKGIIHRDIKPSNVLITLIDGKAMPKVIDFGVAKAIAQRMTEKTMFTQFGAIVGTLEYMSPEAANLGGLDIDTRSDIYSLGVLLYELLTGTTPLEREWLRQAAYLEILRRIKEDEPEKPSSRLSHSGDKLPSVAASRSTEPARLTRLVRGELDWIVMKALEKERGRRYETANMLAHELESYLAGDAVTACAPSRGYRARKFARKHIVALATGGAFVTLLAVATAVSSWLAVRATREQAKAKRSEAEAKAVLGFFRDKVLAAPRPEGQEGGLGHAVILQDALESAESSIATDFANEPIVESAIRDTLGTTHLYLGDSARAIAQHARAMALRSGFLGPEHPDTLRSMNNLAVAYRQAGRVVEAVPLHERDFKISAARLGPDHPDTLTSMSNVGTAYRLTGRTAEAITVLEAVLKRRTAILGPDHADTMLAINNLAVAYQAAGRIADAVALHEKELKHCKSKLGPDHPDTWISMNNLASGYQAIGRIDEAITLFEEVLKRRQAKLRPDHPDILVSMNNLATAYHIAHRSDEAIALFLDTLARRTATLGRGHRETLATMNSLGAVYLDKKQWDDAEPLLRETLNIREQARPDDWRVFYTRSQLGAALTGQRKYAEAEPYLIKGYEGLLAHEAKIPAQRRKTDLATASERIVRLYDAWGNTEKAAAWRRKLASPATDDRPKTP
jgi:eukaryotic-like serine/threonine-protein kinase